MENKTNKLIPIVAVVAVAAVLFIMFVFLKDDGKRSYSIGANKRQVVTVDGDTSDDTLNKLTTDVADFKSNVKGVKEESKKVQQDIGEVKDILIKLQTQNKELKTELQQYKSAQEMTGDSLPQEEAAAQMEGRIMENLQSTIESMVKPYMQSNQNPNKQMTIQVESTEPQGKTRFRGIDLPVDSKGRVDQDYINSLQPTSETKNEGTLAVPKETVVPRYTIPPNSILMDAVTATTLVGRVPISGDVADPAPFKAVIGSENLAANGHSIPGLTGMIISGTVFGDKTLACAYASVTSATYIFEDGRTLTLPDKKSDQKNKRLGWISDDHGNPCVPGTYISNTAKVATSSVLIGAAMGAAGAYAAGETTEIVTDSGSVIESVTGSANKYMQGKAAEGGMEALAQFMASRKTDEWASVIVQAGTKVAFHVEEEMAIDNSSLLRKIDYGNSPIARSGLID